MRKLHQIRGKLNVERAAQVIDVLESESGCQGREGFVLYLKHLGKKSQAPIAEHQSLEEAPTARDEVNGADTLLGFGPNLKERNRTRSRNTTEH